MANPAGDEPEVRPLDYADVWQAVAGRMDGLFRSGFGHLSTEDLLRWQTVEELTERGVVPAELSFEVDIVDHQGRLDLVVGRDDGTAVEFKFPRDRRASAAAADTMTLGELLRDVYRLASISGYGQRWAVMLLNYRLCQHLARRTDCRWTFESGSWIEFGPEGFALLPRTASGSLDAWRDATVTAECVVAEHLDGHRLVAYRVTGPNQTF
jgi:hypothetical protein